VTLSGFKDVIIASGVTLSNDLTFTMQTQINKIFHVEFPIDAIWNFQSDPYKIVTCVPGASLTEKIDDNNYKGEVTVKFGPVKAKYSGQISIEKMDRENYLIQIVGKGLDSKGKGSAEMEMSGTLIEKDNGTEVRYTIIITIMGMLAQFGSRLIQDVSNQLFDQFVANFKSKLKGGEVDSSVDAGSLLGSVIKDKISGIFGGKKEDSKD